MLFYIILIFFRINEHQSIDQYQKTRKISVADLRADREHSERRCYVQIPTNE